MFARLLVLPFGQRGDIVSKTLLALCTSLSLALGRAFLNLESPLELPGGLVKTGRERPTSGMLLNVE